jgi:hypothetical protein
MLHDITGRNRYGNNIVLKEQDKMKKEHEQCHIIQTAAESPAQFKKRCVEVEAESIKCGLSPLTDLRQVMVFVRGLTKGSRAARHFDNLLTKAETTPESFPSTLHEAWESIMILDTLTPVRTTPQNTASTPAHNTHQGKSNNNNNRPTGSNNFKKPSLPVVAEREQTIHVTQTSPIQYHEYPVQSVLITRPLVRSENTQVDYDSVRGAMYQLPGDSDAYDAYEMPPLIEDEDSDEDYEELNAMSLPSVMYDDASDIAERVVSHKRFLDQVVANVRDETNEFWDTMGLALFNVE